MLNPNYDSSESDHGLVIELYPKEKFYVIASPDTQPGDCCQVKEIEVRAESSRHLITANKSLVIIRDAHLARLGGLDEIVRQIKERSFKFGRKRGQE